MKNQDLWRRLGFAWSGLRFAIANERSFRTQLLLGACAIAVLTWLRVPPTWWALFALSASLVLSLELVNTALEQIVDRLHPEQHASIRFAKDCAAAAVLCASCAALLTGLLAIYVTVRGR
ncbi:MAG: diacylglycerol kinase [Steroidobacteraceae bacterium]